MPSTLREVRELVGNKLGGYSRSLVSITPDVTDALAQRQILCAELYDADRSSKGYAGQFAWNGQYRDQRRVRENGYRTVAYLVYQPPTSGSYTITFYGYGITGSLAWNADSDTVELAIQGITGLGGATVTTTDNDVLLVALPSVIDAELSAGTMIAQGGVGALEVNRGFTKALTVGDEIELCSKLPFRDADNVQGLNTLINMALRDMWYIADIPITPVRNSRGTPTFLNLTEYDWLTHESQIIAIFNPSLWEASSVFTPPVSGSYTISIDMGATVYTTGSLLYTDSASTILAALQAALSGVTWTVTDTGATFTIVLSNTRYAQPTISVSAGSVTNSIYRLETPTIYRGGPKFQYNGNVPYIDNLFGVEGESFMIKAYIPAYAYICSQASYGTNGTLWTASTTGLYDDYDMAMPPPDDIASFAYALAADQMAKIDQTDAFWQREAKKAHGIAAGLKTYDFPYDTKPQGNRYGSTAGGWGSKNYWGNWG